MIIDTPYQEERELPEFTLRQIDLPEIALWEVGSSHYIVMKVEMVGKNSVKDANSKAERPKLEAEFEMLSIRALGDKPIDRTTIEKQDFEDLVGKVKSGEM